MAMRLNVPPLSLSAWPGGAIFEKELRVASRRRRHYVLRSVYIGILILFFLIAWWGLVKSGGPGTTARTSSVMSRMAAGLTVSVCMLQLFTGQMMVIFILAGAINQEVRQRTLGVLMSTPLGGLAIVAAYLVVGLVGYLCAERKIRRRIF